MTDAVVAPTEFLGALELCIGCGKIVRSGLCMCDADVPTVFVFTLLGKRQGGEENPYYVATRAQLVALVSGDYDDPEDVCVKDRIRWIREQRVVKIKAAWWTLERRFALRNAAGDIAATYPSRDSALIGWISGDRVVTVKLEEPSGEEVVA